MLVMIDQNELATNPKVVELLKKYYPKLQVMSLEFGDINIVLDSGNLLSIERKNVGDFLGSIGDGRVFRQVEQMSNGAKFCAIILVGGLQFNKDDMAVVDGRETGWKGVSVRAAMMAIQFSGCPILATYQNGLPITIQELINFCEQPEKHMQKLTHKRVVTFPPLDPRIEIVSAFPNIGSKRADALLRFAKSQSEVGDEDDPYGKVVEALVWGSAMSLISKKSRPEGWGDAIVQNFRYALGLDSKEYLDIKKDEK